MSPDPLLASPRRRHPRIALTLLVLVTVGAVAASARPIAPPTRLTAPVPGEEPPAAPPLDGGESPEDRCHVDLERPGQMWDVLSNALLALGIREQLVRAFGKRTEDEYATGAELLRAAAAEFAIAEATLAAEVQRLKHVNCQHGPIRRPDGTVESVPGQAPGQPPDANAESAAPLELTPFARNVALHVVLHELGHALVREFDLPVLGNEETMADAFATHFLVTHMPDRALDAIKARVASLLIEAGDVPREEWPVRGEHDNDARRAFQIAALALAADPVKYAEVAAIVGLTADDIRKATDYGAEIHRGWRRTLAPLWMPAGQMSSEASTDWGSEGDASDRSGLRPLADELAGAIRRFDWHSQIRLRFTDGEGGAAWSRSKRTITVHGQYLRRFVEQGRRWDQMQSATVPSQP